jgi:hypothetical protein
VKRAVVASVLLAAAAAFAQSSAPDPAVALTGAALGRALRDGGHAIYFRHTATDMSRNDADMKSLADCARQRPLSEAGRGDARRIGEAIRALAAAPGDVLASPMCRTMETAQLVFGQAKASEALLLRGSDGSYPELARLFSTPVAAGRNRWIVGHGIPFRAIAGPPHLQEGEAAVLRPDGKGWKVVGRVLPEEWANLR